MLIFFMGHLISDLDPYDEAIGLNQPRSQRYLRFLFFCDGHRKTKSEGSAGIEVGVK